MRRRDWIPGRERGRGEKFESSRGMDEWMGFPEITCLFHVLLLPDVAAFLVITDLSGVADLSK